MKIFDEAVSPTLTNNSPVNFIQVGCFEEIFFNVFEISINGNKYLAEKVSEYEGNPVITLPIEVSGIKKNTPFVLTKGDFDVIYNENLSSEFDEVLEENSNTVEEEVRILDECLESIENDEPEVIFDDKDSVISEQIERAKKQALKQIREENKKRLEILEDQKRKRVKAFKRSVESAKKSLVEEFISLSEKIKKELVKENNSRYEEIVETIDNKIIDISESLSESLDKNYKNTSKKLKSSISEVINEITKILDPKLDSKLEDITNNINEKVNSIEIGLDEKVNSIEIDIDNKIDDRFDVIAKSNIELNDSINKKLKLTESKVKNLYDQKIKELQEKSFDITEDARKYVLQVIEKSRDDLVKEIREVAKRGSDEYIVESKGDKKYISTADLTKEIDKKISEKVDNEVVRLRKYVNIYSSGGGTDAKQFADGGFMNGNLVINGSISAIEYLGLSGGSGSGDSQVNSTVRALSSDWQSTFTTVLANSSQWASGSDDEQVSLKVRASSAAWDSVYGIVDALSSTWGYQGLDLKALSGDWQSTFTTVLANSSQWDDAYNTVYNLSSDWANHISDYLPLSGGTITGDLNVAGNTNTTTLSAHTALFTYLTALSTTFNVIDIKQYELSGFSINGDFNVYGETNIIGNNTLSGNNIILGDTYTVGDSNITGNISLTGNQTITGTLSTATGIYTQYVQFDTTVSPITTIPGLLQWNETEKTLDLTLDVPNETVLRLGQEVMSRVRNTTGSTIPKGSAVYITGSLGNRATVALAKADSGSTSDVLGIAAAPIDHNTDGFVVEFGYEKGIKTNYTGTGVWGTTWVEGDDLYVSNLSAGVLTNVRPEAPHFSDRVGKVVVVGNVGVGSILVTIHPYTRLQELSDVRYNMSALSANGVLIEWNNANQRFEFHDNINNYVSKTYLNTLSSDWQSTFTTVNSNSSRWDSSYNSVNALSSDWQSTFTTVNANSANWESTYTAVSANSAKWESTYQNVLSGKTDWDTTYSTVNAYSAEWFDVENDTATTIIRANSANWITAYTTVNANSAKWEWTYQDVLSGKPIWDSTNTTVNANSARWESSYNTTNNLSTNWQSTNTTVNANSGNWNSVFTTVLSNSAAWSGDPVTTILTGDGSTSVFTISGADLLTNSSALVVVIDGATQTPEVDYTVNNNQITFTSPVLSGATAVVIAPNTYEGGYLPSTLVKPYRETNIETTLNSTDYTLNCLVSSFTVIVPSAVGLEGREYKVKNSGSGVIILSASNGETIDGDPTIPIGNKQCFMIQSTNSNWIIT